MSYPNPIFKYSIEPHGDAHALYWGRSQQMHGYNLCCISDLSHNCDLAILEKTLNEGIEADGLRNRIAELENKLRAISRAVLHASDDAVTMAKLNLLDEKDRKNDS